MKEIPMYLVSAFSERPFAGNPAAVCLLDAWLADDILLKMAQEHNQSETAFVVRDEVNLCGHATLASAHVIFHHLDFPHAAIHFATASGRLTVSREGGWLTLDFPASATQESTPPAALLAGLGLERYVSAHRGRAWLIELASREEVAAVRPNIAAMTPGEHKVTITAPGDGEYDFVSRFFSPGEAVWEDPVTGSAHTMLIPFWSAKLGKSKMLARQISARGGDIRCELKGDRVLMAGQAVTWLQGRILLR